MSNPQTDSSPTIATSNSIGIGHYKGVMLCNRPFGGSIAITSSDDNKPSPFACGVVKESLGLNVSILNKEKIKVTRIKKDSVLSKHRKWLAELQQTKDRLEKQYVQELEEKQIKLEKFNKQVQADRMKTLAFESKETDNQSKETDSQSKDIDNTDKRDVTSANKTSNKKPAWALTAKEADSKEQDYDSDLDQLLDYVNDLDYNKTIDEIEVSTMIDQIKQKITSLEKDIADEDKKEQTTSNISEKKTMLNQLNSTLNNLITVDNTIDSESKSKEDNERIAKAKEVLGQDHIVHSDRSVTALLKTAKDKAISDNNAQPKILNEPKVVVHEPNEGLRLDPLKSTVSNLPYLHRNPAV